MVAFAQLGFRVVDVEGRAGTAQAIHRRAHVAAAADHRARCRIGNRIEQAYLTAGADDGQGLRLRKLREAHSCCEDQHGCRGYRGAAFVEHLPAPLIVFDARDRAAEVRDDVPWMGGKVRGTQAGRLYPAAVRKPPAAVSDRPAAMRAGFLPCDELQVPRWQTETLDDTAHLLLLGVVAGEMQHAAGFRADGQPSSAQARDVPPAIQGAGTCEPAHAVVVEAGQGAEHAGVVSGCAFARAGTRVDHLHPPAARGEPLCHRGAGDTGTDHRRVLGGVRKRYLQRRRNGVGCCRTHVERATVELADEHLPLGAEAGRLLDAEAGAAQALAHLAGDRPGREGRTLGREPCKQMKDAL